jgi:hypothetical protein
MERGRIGRKSCTYITPLTKQVSDIPPSILFMSMVNCCSSASSLYVPLDTSFPDFALCCAEKYRNGNKNHPLYNMKYLVDMKYLNEKGKIRNAGQWNNTMDMRDNMHLHDYNVLGSIQSIVECAREFITYFHNDFQ